MKNNFKLSTLGGALMTIAIISVASQLQAQVQTQTTKQTQAQTKAQVEAKQKAQTDAYLSHQVFEQGPQAHTAPNSRIPFNNVRINMQRMLGSTDGQYFLDLHAGVWNPRATLTLVNVDRAIEFEGLQKGDQLTLSSTATDRSAAGEYQLNGRLNALSGDFNAKLRQRGQVEVPNNVFEPAIKAKDKPALVFKFYGRNDATTQQRVIEQVEVIDKISQQVRQTLSGFQAAGSAVDYKDINFDGYYDLVLQDAVQAQDPEQQRFIYWMYNPKTQQYQRATVMENILGAPSLNGVKQQIRFGQDRVYQVEAGLLKRIP